MRALSTMAIAAAALWLGAATAPAGEVRLRNGNVVQALAVEWDGERLTIVTPQGRVAHPIADVESLTIEAVDPEAERATQERLTRQDKELEAKQATINKLRSEQAEAKKATDRIISDKLDLENRVRELEKDLKAREKKIAELNAASRQTGASEAEAERDRLQAEVEKLNGQIADLREQLEQARAADPKPPTPKTPLEVEIASRRTIGEGLTLFTGTVRNPNDAAFETVIVEIAAVDAEGNPLSVGRTWVSQLAPGASAAFQIDLTLPEAGIDRIDKRAFPAR